MDRGLRMQAESFHHDDDAETGGQQTPGDTPPQETPEAKRRPIIAFFTRRAFLSKDTGRWHKLTGGRDHPGDERADDPAPSDPR